jgi:hypothetical protein
MYRIGLGRLVLAVQDANPHGRHKEFAGQMIIEDLSPD